jgi:hypothetical protein
MDSTRALDTFVGMLESMLKKYNGHKICVLSGAEF